jgi:hypothetical protein
MSHRRVKVLCHHGMSLPCHQKLAQHINDDNSLMKDFCENLGLLWCGCMSLSRVMSLSRSVRCLKKWPWLSESPIT